MTGLARLATWVAGRRYPLIPVALALWLASPCLLGGLSADDFYIRSVVLGLNDIPRHNNPWRTYSYLDGVPEHTQELVDKGLMPWWTDPHARANLWRPLTALTQIIDFRLWPEYPALMHFHSLLWFGGVVWMACILYRRIVPCGAGGDAAAVATGLAALMFAVDDAHAMPAGWLANRNALIAAFFGFGALIAHDRWRRDGWRMGAVAGPVLFVLALLGKEEGASVAAYLLAYALLLDTGRWSARLAALLPCAMAGLVWLLVYRLSGFGVANSDVYIDPVSQPLTFVERVVRNGPVLLLGQLAVPASDLSNFLSLAAFRVHWVFAVVVLCAFGWWLRPLLAAERSARFWALGMVVSTLPVCAIFPGDRLLMFPSLGAMGLLGTWLADWTGAASPRLSLRGRAARAVGWTWVTVHVVLAPLMLPVLAISMRLTDAVMDRIYAGLPADAAFGEQTGVFVTSFNCLGDLLWYQTRRDAGRPVPERWVNFGPSCSATVVRRIDERTLLVRPVGGYLREPGRGVTGPAPMLSGRHLAHRLDRLVRSPHRPLARGQRVQLPDVTVTVVELTPDGRPSAVTFEFTVPLDDPSLRWLRATWDGFVPVTVPAVGEQVTVPSPMSSVRLW